MSKNNETNIQIDKEEQIKNCWVFPPNWDEIKIKAEKLFF